MQQDPASKQFKIAKQKQAMKIKLREMFLSKPGSVEHNIKIIAYDLMLMQLRAMENEGNYEWRTLSGKPNGGTAA